MQTRFAAPHLPPCPIRKYIVCVSIGQPATRPPQQAMTEANPYRWVILFLLWLLYASFGVTAATIPPLVDPIIKDLNMSFSQMGLILGAWQFVYIFTASPLGALVDRLGVRRSLGIGIIIVWVSLVLRGFAVDFYTLLFAVALFGVGGPIISIGAPKVVSLWFQGNQRNLAAGIYTTGPLSGMAIALATAAGVVMPLTGSWRGISLIYGAVLLVIIAAWWLFSRDAPLPASESSQTSSDKESSLTVIYKLLRLRNVQVVLVMAFATFLLNHGLSNWLPTLLQEGGMTITQAGIWTALGTAIGVSGLLVIPPLARHGYRALTMALLLGVAVVATLGLAYTTGTSAYHCTDSVQRGEGAHDADTDPHIDGNASHWRKAHRHGRGAILRRGRDRRVRRAIPPRLPPRSHGLAHLGCVDPGSGIRDVDIDLAAAERKQAWRRHPAHNLGLFS